MGRPPIGKVAMTSTERSRRYRAGLASKPAPATKPAGAATKPKAEPERDDRSAEKDREIARLKARNLELELEINRLKAEPTIDPASLPKSYREKFEAMCRRQNREYEARVKQGADARARKLYDEFFLPNLRERLEKAERQNKALDAAIDRRTPIISRALFRKALACLHPDSRTGASEKMYNEAYAAFSEKGKDGVNKVEIALCGKEADRPQRPPLPTWAEMMAARERVRAENSARAKRAAATRAARKASQGEPDASPGG
jgi:hypothetical protein